MDSKIITIMLVDDHDILRHGLRESFEQKSDIKIIKEADNGREAVIFAEKLCPNVIIMDINMPDLNGIEATEQILVKNPQIKIIALSMLCDQSSIMRMLDAGAKGFLLKTCSFDELYNTVIQVSSGKISLCTQAQEIVMENALNPYPGQTRPAISKLTPREREILQLIAEGNTSNDIAQKINVKKRTVDIHKSNIMNKLKIKSIAGLTKFAIKEGVIPL